MVTELEPSVTLSRETWNLACMITESQDEAEDLVQAICNGFAHLSDDEQSVAVTIQINLLASKVMTRH